MDLPDDRHLLEAWRAGDRKASNQLLDRYYDLVRRTIATKVPERAVDDLTQRVLTALVERRDRIREGASVRAYILAITRRAIADFYRRPDAAFDPIVDSVTAHGAGPLTLLDARSESRLLLEALRAIPLDDQFVLELYLWEDLSAPELAQIFEATEGAIRSRIRRAKDRLRDAVTDLRRDRRELADTVTDLDAWAHRLRLELRARLPNLRP